MLPRSWSHEPAAADQPHRVGLHTRRALIGMFVRMRKDTRRGYQDVARLRTGLIETIAGLVLSLLVASANTTYETKHDELKELTSNTALLDTTLAQYGFAMYSARRCQVSESGPSLHFSHSPKLMAIGERQA